MNDSFTLFQSNIPDLSRDVSESELLEQVSLHQILNVMESLPLLEDASAGHADYLASLYMKKYDLIVSPLGDEPSIEVTTRRPFLEDWIQSIKKGIVEKDSEWRDLMLIEAKQHTDEIEPLPKKSKIFAKFFLIG